MTDPIKTIADIITLAGAATNLGTTIAGAVNSPTNRERRLARQAALRKRVDLMSAARKRARATRLRNLAASLKPRAQRRKARLLARANRNERLADVLNPPSAR